MKPFVLKQHEKDFAKVRELRPEELETVVGGKKDKVRSVTVTPDGDGGDDGMDSV